MPTAAWMDATEIPADKPSNGVGSDVYDRNQEQLHAIVTGARRQPDRRALRRATWTKRGSSSSMRRR